MIHNVSSYKLFEISYIMNTRTIETVTAEIATGKLDMETCSAALNGLEGKALRKATHKLKLATDSVATLETELAGLVEAARVAAAAPKPSKVARIDQLFIAAAKVGNGTIAKDEPTKILAIINTEYPGINESATMKTIRCRPWHIREAIKNGKLKDVVLNKRAPALVA
jgi:hypothetical protein